MKHYDDLIKKRIAFDSLDISNMMDLAYEAGIETGFRPYRPYTGCEVEQLPTSHGESIIKWRGQIYKVVGHGDWMEFIATGESCKYTYPERITPGFDI